MVLYEGKSPRTQCLSFLIIKIAAPRSNSSPYGATEPLKYSNKQKNKLATNDITGIINSFSFKKTLPSCCLSFLTSLGIKFTTKHT